MNVVLFTIELYQGREYLMPWRTLWEVARVMEKNGHSVTVLSAQNDASNLVDYAWHDVHIKSVANNAQVIVMECCSLFPDILFVPMSFRDGIKRPLWLKHIDCKKIAYIPGGVFDLKSAFWLAKSGGISWSKSFLLECIVPKFLFSNMLNKVGISYVIGLTEYTSERVKKSGFSAVTTIYPGKDSFDEITPDNSILEKYELIGKRWLLFSGAPAATRGAVQLLKAVDDSENNELRLVMLMRTDVGSEYSSFERAFATMKHPKRVMVVREKLTRNQLRAFFGAAWYAILPFIVIPSEIPLTYFELFSCGTPVVSFNNGGTTRYLEDGLLVAEKSMNGLRCAIDRAWVDDILRDKKSMGGKAIMDSHFTWEQVGRCWLDLMELM